MRHPRATAALRPPTGDQPTGTAQYPRLNQRHCSPPGRRPSTVGLRRQRIGLNLILAQTAHRPISTSDCQEKTEAQVKVEHQPAPPKSTAALRPPPKSPADRHRSPLLPSFVSTSAGGVFPKARMGCISRFAVLHFLPYRTNKTSPPISTSRPSSNSRRRRQR